MNYESNGECDQRSAVCRYALIVVQFIGPILMFIPSAYFSAIILAIWSGIILIGLFVALRIRYSLDDIGGGAKYGATLVALNSAFQILTYSIMAWLFITVLPPLFGYQGFTINISIIDIAESVLIYLGIPFLCWFVSVKLACR